jgi:hypothetical protein
MVEKSLDIVAPEFSNQGKKITQDRDRGVNAGDLWALANRRAAIGI